MRKPIAAVALALFAGIAAAQAQKLSDAADHAHRAVPARRLDRHSAARILGERMRQPLGQTVVIENAGGAGGSIALGRVARAAPDGYTNRHRPVGHARRQHHLPAELRPAEGFRADRADFINPQLMIARKDFPAGDLKGLVAWMKVNPGQGDAGRADRRGETERHPDCSRPPHDGALHSLSRRRAGDAGDARRAGRPDGAPGRCALPQARGGAVKIIANLSPKRSAAIPDVPTTDESGIPGLYAAGWFGLFGPKECPAGRRPYQCRDGRGAGGSGAQGALLRSGPGRCLSRAAGSGRAGGLPPGEIEKWWPIIKAAGIKAE